MPACTVAKWFGPKQDEWGCSRHGRIVFTERSNFHHAADAAGISDAGLQIGCWQHRPGEAAPRISLACTAAPGQIPYCPSQIFTTADCKISVRIASRDTTGCSGTIVHLLTHSILTGVAAGGAFKPRAQRLFPAPGWFCGKPRITFRFCSLSMWYFSTDDCCYGHCESNLMQINKTGATDL